MTRNETLFDDATRTLLAIGDLAQAACDRYTQNGYHRDYREMCYLLRLEKLARERAQRRLEALKKEEA